MGISNQIYLAPYAENYYHMSWLQLLQMLLAIHNTKYTTVSTRVDSHKRCSGAIVENGQYYPILLLQWQMQPIRDVKTHSHSKTPLILVHGFNIFRGNALYV